MTELSKEANLVSASLWNQLRERGWLVSAEDTDAIAFHFEKEGYLRSDVPVSLPETRYRFTGRATGQDPQGYYYARMDRAQLLSVVAATRDEATQRAVEMLGKHPQFGDSQNHGWAIQWKEINEVTE